MPHNVGLSGVWRDPIAKSVGLSGVWRTVRKRSVGKDGLWHLVYESLFTVDITSDQSDFILRPLLLAMSWNGITAIDMIVNIQLGVDLRPGASNRCFRTGSPWPTGTTLRINNSGNSPGKGGTGGNGEGDLPAVNGSTGFDAWEIDLDIILAASPGFIGGGGGGGAGGAKLIVIDTPPKGAPTTTKFGGGGGGGGAGSGPGGTRGTGSGFILGTNGSPGTEVNPSGALGLHGNRGDGDAADAANGGDWATTGNSSSVATGGGAGKAIRTNGHNVTIVSGNDTNHIRGAIS